MILTNGQFRFVFFTRDYKASVEFYHDGLGLPIDHDWDYGPGDKGTVFKAGNGMVEVMALAPGADYTSPQGCGLYMQVKDADRSFRLAKERRLPVVQEPETFPWGQRAFKLSDPDGVVLTLFQDVSQA